MPVPQVRGIGWQRAAVKWDPYDSPMSPPNSDLSTRTSDDIRLKSVQLTEGEKRMDAERREWRKSEYFIYILSN